MCRFSSICLLAIALVCSGVTGVCVAQEGFARQQIEFFENRIRPLLANRCQSCHGGKKSENDLRVDARDYLLRGGASARPAAIPGDADGSLLIAAVSHEADYDMPPDGKLSDREIADLKRWISEGLPWPENESVVVEQTFEDRLTQQRKNHWSFQPILRPQVPDAARVMGATPIDAFLLEKLQQHGLAFSPPADKATLIRRSTFDLTGLPPTFEEVQSFVADHDRDAYGKLVDRLLDSPHYGQRWARHWLDVARYADTAGYALDDNSRDYPFAYTYRDYVVRAFNADLPYNEFVRQQLAADQLTDDPHDPALAALGFLTVGRKYLARPDVVDDRIDVVTRGLMGLTVGCARCHDHKFDAIATEDYYALYGVFNNCDVPDKLPVVGRPPSSAGDFIAELNVLKAAVVAAKEDARNSTRRHALEHIDQYAVAALLAEPEDRLRSAGVIDLSTEAYRGSIPDALSKHWRSKSDKALVAKTLAALEQELSFTRRQVIARQFAAPLKVVADRYLGPENFGLPWETVFPASSQLHGAASLLLGPDGPLQWRFGLFRVLIKRSDLIAIRKRKAAVTVHLGTSPRGFDAAMVVKDRSKIEPPYIMIRGDVDRRGETVPRRFPQIFFQGRRKNYSQGAGRLELANDIVRPDNPLTARVIVNRIWMHHFGNPLVGTPSDFGIQGEPPTHQKLLDWMAADFMDSGWSLKTLHRKIMLTAAYQQSSRSTAVGRTIDVENKWLWRMNRRRLEIEALRDAMLSVAGRLDLSLGGRGVKQFEPPYDQRRTLYGLIDRQQLAAELRIFDVASPDQSTPKRSRTDVPQQSLFLMNSPWVVEQGDALAKRAAVGGELSQHDFVDRLFRLALSRDPTAQERAAMVGYITSADSDGRQRAGHLMLMMNEFGFID